MRLLQGLALLELERAAKGQQALEPLAAARRPEIARQAVLALAGHWLEEGRIEAGLGILDAARGVFPLDPKLAHLCARFHEEDGEGPAALSLYRQAAQHAAPAASLLADLGRVRLKDGQIAAGLSDWRRAWLEDPTLFPAAVLGDPDLAEEL